MLKEKGIPFRYRDYKEEPLSEEEIRQVLNMMGMSAGEVFRKNDRANKALGLTGKEDEDTLIRYMAAHPTLLQRPIGIRGNRAVLGRPPERLLELVG